MTFSYTGAQRQGGHCPGCHGHVYDESSSYCDDDHSPIGTRPTCRGLPSLPPEPHGGAGRLDALLDAAKIADREAAIWEQQATAIEAQPDDTFVDGARTKAELIASHAHTTQACLDIAREIRALVRLPHGGAGMDREARLRAALEKIKARLLAAEPEGDDDALTTRLLSDVYTIVLAALAAPEPPN